jgi:hypothetical protein
MKGKEIIEFSTMSHCLGEIIASQLQYQVLEVYKEDGGSLEEVVTWTTF